MDGATEIFRTFSEPDNLFLLTHKSVNGIKSTIVDNGNNSSHYLSNSSFASLIHADSQPPLPNDPTIPKSHSLGHLDAACRLFIQKHGSHVCIDTSQKSSSTLSSSSYDDTELEGRKNSTSPKYSRLDESAPFEESTPNAMRYVERMLRQTAIPRRREFSEQFRDLAQLHECHEASGLRAKWDDASRLFPKQFGLPPSVAISIWKQVDRDGDMMLTESEYCLAAHLATKYSATGFSLLAPLVNRSQPDGEHGRSRTPSPLPTRQRHHRHHRRNAGSDYSNGRGGGNAAEMTMKRDPDIGYLDNAEDHSHDYLLSPDDARSLHRADGASSPWNSSSRSSSPSSSSSSNTSMQEDDVHKVEDEDDIGVRALLPSSNRHRRRRRLRRHGDSASDSEDDMDDYEDGDDDEVTVDSHSSSSSEAAVSSSSDESSSPSSSMESSSEEDYSSISSSDSTSPVLGRTLTTSSIPRTVESVTSVSPAAKATDPIEVLAKFTHRSPEELLLLPPKRRRRLLASLVRAAKSTNYTLLRLNNELAGELQELCDQHTSLNAQVRHLSEMG